MKSRKPTVCSYLYAKSYCSNLSRNTDVNKVEKVDHYDVMKKNSSLQIMIDDLNGILFSVLQFGTLESGLEFIFSSTENFN